MIRALYRTQAGHTRTDLKLDAVAMALGDDSGLVTYRTQRLDAVDRVWTAC
jgi:hypothetical protein